jgi:putative spermidine/putrescine transport system permease protein
LEAESVCCGQLLLYQSVFSSAAFLNTISYSTIASLVAILIGAIIIVPTAYWVRLKVPKLRPVVEFISLLPLILPPVVLVFSYIRLFGSNSWLSCFRRSAHALSGSSWPGSR